MTGTARVLLLGTADTKSAELGFLSSAIAEAGDSRYSWTSA